MNDLLCGCGRPARYYTRLDQDGKGSCNKYMRCPTYEQLSESLKKANKTLAFYQHAVNQLDDYFEYAMESKKDQKKVHQVLGNLADALKDT